MLGAIMLVHLAGGFFMPNGIEFPLALLGATTALALTGPGTLSLDTVIARRRETTRATISVEPTGDRRAA
jgi:putative oxidoreductase